MIILAIGLTLVLFGAAWLFVVGWPVDPFAIAIGFMVVVMVWVTVLLTPAAANMAGSIS